MTDTYDRFCGSWWGSIIGQAILDQGDHPFSQPWLIERRQIAQMILTQQLSTINLTNNLTKLSLGFDSAFPMSSQVNNPAKGLQFSNYLLSWLPLIFFQLDESYLERTKKSNLPSANGDCQTYPVQNLLIWGYLLTSVLHQPNELFEKKLLMIEEVFQRNLLPAGLLSEKLLIVFAEIKSGSSLQQLTEKLSSPDQLQTTAIALAWYCFVTTPKEFKLSVQRAARLETPVARLTTVLTSTLSGAYNGMATISRHWSAKIKGQPDWQIENHLLLTLFKFWLGIYTVEDDHQSYNRGLEAISLPKLIQPRKNLKIISQSSSS